MTTWNAGATGVRREERADPIPKYIWNGEEYFSQSDVAEEAGCTTRAVRLHLQRHGNLDQLKPALKPRASPKAQKFTFAGAEYPSIRKFAAAHDLCPYRVTRLARAGKIDRIAQLLEAAQ